MTPYEPSDREDEYFLKLDKEKIKKRRSELDVKRDEEAKLNRKQTHWMKCPKCGSDLNEMNYQNVMIDTCQECKGIWLDQGEIELLVKGQAQVTKSFFKKLFD
jgi:ribosomal protein L37AE/L43A